VRGVAYGGFLLATLGWTVIEGNNKDFHLFGLAHDNEPRDSTDGQRPANRKLPPPASGNRPKRGPSAALVASMEIADAVWNIKARIGFPRMCNQVARISTAVNLR